MTVAGANDCVNDCPPAEAAGTSAADVAPVPSTSTSAAASNTRCDLTFNFGVEPIARPLRLPRRAAGGLRAMIAAAEARQVAAAGRQRSPQQPQQHGGSQKGWQQAAAGSATVSAAAAAAGGDGCGDGEDWLAADSIAAVCFDPFNEAVVAASSVGCGGSVSGTAGGAVSVCCRHWPATRVLTTRASEDDNGDDTAAAYGGRGHSLVPSPSSAAALSGRLLRHLAARWVAASAQSDASLALRRYGAQLRAVARARAQRRRLRSEAAAARRAAAAEAAANLQVEAAEARARQVRQRAVHLLGHPPLLPGSALFGPALAGAFRGLRMKHLAPKVYAEKKDEKRREKMAEAAEGRGEGRKDEKKKKNKEKKEKKAKAPLPVLRHLTIKERLEYIWKARAPEKLKTVDAVVREYRGRQQELLRKLSGEYGDLTQYYPKDSANSLSEESKAIERAIRAAAEADAAAADDDGSESESDSDNSGAQAEFTVLRDVVMYENPPDEADGEDGDAGDDGAAFGKEGGDDDQSDGDDGYPGSRFRRELEIQRYSSSRLGGLSSSLGGSSGSSSSNSGSSSNSKGKGKGPSEAERRQKRKEQVAGIIHAGTKVLVVGI
eukprot:g1938.t1